MGVSRCEGVGFGVYSVWGSIRCREKSFGNSFLFA